MSRRVLCILGTRPEVIKLAPVVRALRERDISVTLCSTRQHDEMLTRTLKERDLHVSFAGFEFIGGQTLDDTTTRILNYLSYAVPAAKPDLVLVQGDTTTALCGALSAFYHQVPVGHVEAGLRTKTPMYPYPEEMNRRLISRLATLHFAPTPLAFDNLKAETAGMLGNGQLHIEMTGNTIVDELQRVIPTLSPWKTEYEHLVVVTCHRREQQTERVTALREQLWAFALKSPDALVLWSLHPNPLIQEIARAHECPKNVELVEPLDYPKFLSALMRASLVVTDSGGVVEEATTLRRPLLVIRDETERPEANAPLVTMGAMPSLAAHMLTMLKAPSPPPTLLSRLVQHVAPSVSFNHTFGQGDAGKKIAKAIENWLQ